MEIIKPKRLSPGDTISLVTPSSPISEAQFEMLAKTEAIINSWGVKVRYGKHIRKSREIWAGTVEERAEDLMSAFCDSEIGGIFAIRGGSVALEVAEKLDYQKIKERIIKFGAPVFMGYSDITVLHQALFRKLGLATIHCINAINLTQDLPLYVMDSVVKTITQPVAPGNVLHGYVGETITPIKTGTAIGRLIGGNLTSLASIMGTPYEPDITLAPLILYIEDINEEPRRINRLLNQLMACPFFKNVNGIVCGTFINCVDEHHANLSAVEVLQEKFSQLDIPVAFGFPFGHSNDNVTLPNGLSAQLIVNNNSCDLEIMEAAVL
jgi:muramoyltetrapeptide carboxypeptidase